MTQDDLGGCHSDRQAGPTLICVKLILVLSQQKKKNMAVKMTIIMMTINKHYLVHNTKHIS